MNAFEKRISLEDIKPGVVVWPVFSVTGSVAVVMNPVEFASGPYRCDTIGAWRFQFNKNEYGCSNYVNDNNVKLPNNRQYNFHALFLNKKDAEEYAEMINSNTLPDDLRALRDQFVAEQQEERENDPGDFW